jgi:TPR repeat protein
MLRIALLNALVAFVLIAPESRAAQPLDCNGLEKLGESAREGITEAQTELGWDYLQGKCLSKNIEQAKKWLAVASEHGDANAMTALGVLYHGVGEDEKAAEVASQAAKMGEPNAQSLLAWLYYLGKGVPKDDGEALKWARESAEKNVGGGLRLLGLMYQKGIARLPKDQIEALKWYILADRAEHKQDECCRRSVERNMSEQEIAEAKQRADIWKPKTEVKK